MPLWILHKWLRVLNSGGKQGTDCGWRYLNAELKPGEGMPTLEPGLPGFGIARFFYSQGTCDRVSSPPALPHTLPLIQTDSAILPIASSPA